MQQQRWRQGRGGPESSPRRRAWQKLSRRHGASRAGLAELRPGAQVEIILSPPIQIGSMARMKHVEFGPEIRRRQGSTLTARLRRRCRVTKPPAQFTRRSVESCETRPRRPANYLVLPQGVPGFGRSCCHHVATSRGDSRGIEQPNSAVDGRWTQVHVPLRRRQVLVPREVLNRPGGSSPHREMRTERMPPLMPRAA
jgi:hypothetical protein